MKVRVLKNGHVIDNVPRDPISQILIESGLIAKVGNDVGECNLHWSVALTKNLESGKVEPCIQAVCLGCKILTAFFTDNPNIYVWHKREKSFPLDEIVQKFREVKHASTQEKVAPAL